MRTAYVVDHNSGSRAKYGEMFGRILGGGMTTVKKGKYRPGKFESVIVMGDRNRDYIVPLRNKTPYLVVEHDVCSMRGADVQHEKEMLENATAVLFTSEEHQAYCAERFDMPYSEVVHLRPPDYCLDFAPLPKIPNSIVYAGGLTEWDSRDGLYGYRAYHDIFKKLMKSGMEVHLYPAWTRTASMCGEFADLGCIVHEQVAQEKIYEELSQYEMGLMGYAKFGSQEYVKSCRPNKTWEYLAAGIPTLGYNTGNSGAIFDKKWGVIAKSLNGIPKAIEAARKLKITEKMRRAQVIDNDIGVFDKLVYALKDECRKRSRPIGNVVALPFDITFRDKQYRRSEIVPTALAREMHAAGLIYDVRL